MKTKNYLKTEELVLPSGWVRKSANTHSTLHNNMKKLFTLFAVIAVTSFFTAKADWVKNVTLANYEFLTSPAFTTANSNLSGNNVGGPTLLNGYMYTTASGSGNRGTKITTMTETTARQDTVYYEFDWNPYQIAGQANSSGTAGIYPDHYGVCVVRGSNDSIVFGLMYERWSLKGGSKFNTDSLNKQPLGDIHLMNLSTDPNNPVPARVVTQTKPDLTTWSFYTNTLVPFAMLDQNYSSSYYAVKCDSINQTTDIGRTFKMSRWYHIKAVIDFMNKKLISFEIYERDVPTNKKTFTNLPFVNTGVNDASRFEIAATRGKNEGATSGASCNYEQRFDNFDIYTMRQAVAASVTIRYKGDDGTEIKTARVIPNIEVNTVFTASASDKVTIIIGEDYYVYDATSTDNVNVQLGGSEINLRFKKAIPKNTVVQLTAPASSELYKDLTVNIAVKTAQNDIVSSGDVLLYVNSLVKNRVAVDVMGTGSVTFPNLLVGDENISAVFIGDHINYSNSDTARAVISITPSTASVKPYPVYFDLCDQPEIVDWDRQRGMTTATPRGYTRYFRRDSLAGITVTDTINNTHKVGYYLAAAGTYDKIDNAYNRADFVIVPLGSSRPTWVKFKTPWLNAGSYNIYISYRVSGDPKTNMASITMNDKELYFPNEEMYGRWFKSWAGANNRRQWNAKAHSGSMGMNYIGTASIDNSGTHFLKINVLPENGASYNIDMLQFIPVDMDSLNINISAATSMAKKYWPMFDWLGFARQADFPVENVPVTYTDFTQFAIPYQVTDLTDWGTKYGHTIDSVGLKKRLIGTDEYVANYVTVYRAEDRWTRVAEGYGNATTFDFTCNLPKGNYYYEAIQFTDLGDGAQDYRTFINSGYFSVGPSAVDNNKVSNIKAYAFNRTLTVKGIQEGASIMVVDLTGRTLVNAISKSDVFTTALPQGVYLVKVVSGEILRTKVLVK